MAATTISSLAQLRRLRSHVDLLIQPPLAEVSMLDWNAFNFTVEAGYRHAMEILEKRRVSCSRGKICPGPRPVETALWVLSHGSQVRVYELAGPGAILGRSPTKTRSHALLKMRLRKS